MFKTCALSAPGFHQSKMDFISLTVLWFLLNRCSVDFCYLSRYATLGFCACYLLLATLTPNPNPTPKVAYLDK